MKFCESHWGEVRAGTERLLAANIAAIQFFAERVTLPDFSGDFYRSMEALDSKGGCPACYSGPTFVPDLLTRLKDGRLPLKSESKP